MLKGIKNKPGKGFPTNITLFSYLRLKKKTTF